MTTTEGTPSKPIQNQRPQSIGSGAKTAYGVMLLGALVLAATGIGTFGAGKAPMSNWVLMGHVCGAPLFAIGLALVALTWADGARFGNANSPHRGLTRALLWLILLCGLVVLLSGVVPMTPVYGTGGQRVLYLTHRYSGIVFAIAVILHFFSVSRGR